jgi:hypothetical protein
MSSDGGGVDGGGELSCRGAQSVQSVPALQSLVVLPRPPSSQTASSEYGQEFVQTPETGGGDVNGEGGKGDGGRLGGVVELGAKISPALKNTFGVL